MSGRRLSFTQITVTALNNSNTPIAPPNPRRCALLLSGSANDVEVNINGDSPIVTSGGIAGIVVGPARGAVYLPPEVVEGILTGPISGNGVTGNGKVYVTEWYYVG